MHRRIALQKDVCHTAQCEQFTQC